MTQLHGPDHGKPQFLLDSDALARVVGTAVGAALAQLEDPGVEQRHQQLLDAVHDLRADRACDEDAASGDSYGMREVPCDQAHPDLHDSVATRYDPDGRLRVHVSDDREDTEEPVASVRRGGVRYGAQQDTEDAPDTAPAGPEHHPWSARDDEQEG